MRIVNARLHTGECFLPFVLPQIAEDPGAKNQNKLLVSKSKMNQVKASAVAAKQAQEEAPAGRHQSCLHLPSRPYEAVDAVRTSAKTAQKNKDDDNTEKGGK